MKHQILLLNDYYQIHLHLMEKFMDTFGAENESMVLGINTFDLLGG